jgi:hypothetical protein
MRTIIELSDAELSLVSGGEVGAPLSFRKEMVTKISIPMRLTRRRPTTGLKVITVLVSSLPSAEPHGDVRAIRRRLRARRVVLQSTHRLMIGTPLSRSARQYRQCFALLATAIVKGAAPTRSEGTEPAPLFR